MNAYFLLDNERIVQHDVPTPPPPKWVLERPTSAKRVLAPSFSEATQVMARNGKEDRIYYRVLGIQSVFYIEDAGLSAAYVTKH